MVWGHIFMSQVVRVPPSLSRASRKAAGEDHFGKVKAMKFNTNTPSLNIRMYGLHIIMSQLIMSWGKDSTG